MGGGNKSQMDSLSAEEAAVKKPFTRHLEWIVSSDFRLNLRMRDYLMSHP
jgi:hypothetical protein